MRIRYILVASGAVFLAMGASAQAELRVTEEAGVSVTRGVVQTVKRDVDQSLHGADFTLPRDFRGPVFGKPLLFINGEFERRDRVVYSRGRCCSW